MRVRQGVGAERPELRAVAITRENVSDDVRDTREVLRSEIKTSQRGGLAECAEEMHRRGVLARALRDLLHDGEAVAHEHDLASGP